MKLDNLFYFVTDAATLTVFDPVTIAHRSNEEDWWIISNLASVPEIANGVMAIVNLDADGVYNLRVTTDSLTTDEKNFAVDMVTMGVEIQSGQIFIGRGEVIPMSGNSFDSQPLTEDDGQLLQYPAGKYILHIYAIKQQDQVELPENLPNIVILIKPLENMQNLTVNNAYLNLNNQNYLFPSAANHVEKGLKLGLVLNAKVFSSPRTESGKILTSDIGKISWPREYFHYAVLLEDMSQVVKGDRVKIKTVRIDEDNKIIYAELIERRSK